MRHLTLGPLQNDLMRVVDGGLQPNDVAVLDNLLKMRPGEKVESAGKFQKIHENLAAHETEPSVFCFSTLFCMKLQFALICCSKNRAGGGFQVLLPAGFM